MRAAVNLYLTTIMCGYIAIIVNVNMHTHLNLVSKNKNLIHASRVKLAKLTIGKIKFIP